MLTGKLRTVVTSAIVALAAFTVAPTAAAARHGTDGPVTDGLVTVKGKVQHLVVDTRDERSLVTKTYLDASGRLLDVPDRLAGRPLSGTEVTATLRAPAGVTTAAAARTATEVVALAPTASAMGSRSATGVTTKAALGAHTLTVLPVYWTNPTWPGTPDFTLLAQHAAQYWADQSSGRISLTYDVRDWKKITGPLVAGCDYRSIYTQALAAHAVPDPTSLTTHVLIYFPPYSACNWNGLGDLNGSRMWINGDYNLQSDNVATHEFGHNLGLGHSNTLLCKDPTGIRVPLWEGGCTSFEYGGPDVMGAGATGAGGGNLNSGFADHLGLAQVTTVTTTPVTVDLAPLSAMGTMRSIRIPANGYSIYIDYRPYGGRDTLRPRWAGVQVHQVIGATTPTARILDMQTTLPLDTAVNLPLGGTWHIPYTDKTITLSAITPTAATVSVTTSTTPTGPIVAPPDTTPPQPITITSPTADQKTPRPSFSVAWTQAIDPESDISNYTLYVNDIAVASARTMYSTGAIPLKEGLNPLNLRVVATNGAGLQTSATRSLTITVDTITPSAPTGLTIDPNWSTLTWTAPPNAGTPLTYCVYVDGWCVLGTSETSVPVSRLFPAASIWPQTRHRFQVFARDGVNHDSSLSTALWSVAPSTGPMIKH